MNSQPENFFPFEKLLVALVRSGVDFAVVGGIAISMNGYVRATEDADIIISDAPENLRKLLPCLEQWGEGWARELKVEDFVVQEGSVRLIEDFILDMFTRMRGKSLDDFRPPTSFFSNRIPRATRTSLTCRPCGKSSRAKAIDRLQPVAGAS